MLIVTPGASLADRGAPLIVYGDKSLPPYEFVEGGEAKGVNVDLLRAIGNALGRPVDVRLIDWAEAQERVRKGEGHALTFVSETPERRELYDFSQTTFRISFSLFVRADVADGLTMRSLAGRRIGVTAGGLARQVLAAHHPEATLVIVDDTADGMRRVLRGTIDAYASNTWTGIYFLHELHIAGVRPLDEPLTRNDTALAVPRGNPALVAALDQAITQVKADGTYDRIIDRWSGDRMHVFSEREVRLAGLAAGLAVVAVSVIGLLLFVTQARRRALLVEMAERQKAEAALAEREAQLRLFVEHAPAAIAMFDTTMHYLAYSRRFLTDFFGMTDRDLHALSHYDVFPEIPKRWRDVHERCLAGATERCDEDPFPRANGTVDWVRWSLMPWRDASGRIGGLVLFSELITETKLARDALTRLNAELEQRVDERTAALSQALADLRQAQDRYRAIFHSTFQFTGLLTPDGTLIEANRAALDFGGLSEAEVIGRPFWEARWWTADAAGRDRLKAAIAEAAAGRFVRYDAEVRGAGDTRALIDFSLKPIADDAGRIIYLVPEGRDITELRTAQTAMGQLQKMEALGQLTGGVAHDFNNVLQGVSSCLAAIEPHVCEPGPDESDGAAEPRIRRLFEAARHGIDRGARLVQHLLAFARRQDLSPRPTDLGRLIGAMRPLLERTMGGLIQVETDVPPGIWPATIDPTQLELALLNLAINARDAMPGGGRLVVCAGNRSNPAPPPARTTQGEPTPPDELPVGDYVAVSVIDTGSGMDQETLERVFEPFFTTKAVGQGSGLGLSMVHGMAAQSGGGTTIASAPGRGTTVTLYLPRAMAEAECEPSAPPADAAPPPLPAPRPGPVPTVLLVDDDELIRFAATELLGDAGYEVIAAAGGAEAMDVLGRAIELDAVVTDYAMPGMNGAALLKAAARMRPGVPMILMTGYTDRFVAEPGVTVLHKPFPFETLADKLRHLLPGPAGRVGADGVEEG